MQHLKSRITLVLAGTLLAGAAAADQQPLGRGLGQHAQRHPQHPIDTRGDNTTFRDFVRYGNGADSVNRYATDDARGRRYTATQSRKAERKRGGEQSRNGRR
ncbi:MAG: hypothetical protein R3E86_06690 [Pseudomonadales bacterium]